MLLSVVVPVYGTENYLNQCIDSIVSSTLRGGVRLELIIVNDCSPGDTDRIVEQYRGKLDIKYIKHPVNRGLFQARLSGFKAAHGDWITSIDSDDFFYSLDFFEVLQEAEKEGTDIFRMFVLSGTTPECVPADYMAWMESNWGFVSSDHKRIWNWFTADMRWAMHGTVYSSKLIKNALNYIDLSLRNINSNEDLVFNSVFFYLAKKVVVRKTKGFYFYRLNSDSMVHRSWSTFDKVSKVVLSIESVKSGLDYFISKAKLTDSEREKLTQLNTINISFILQKSKEVFIKHIDLLEKLQNCYDPLYFYNCLINEDMDLAARLVSYRNQHFQKNDTQIKKIIFVTHVLGNGGAEKCIVKLGEIFERLGNISVQFIVGSTNGDYQSLTQCKTIQISKDSERLISLGRYLINYVPDFVIFVDHWSVEVFREFLFTKLLGIKTICMEHSSFFFPIFDNHYREIYLMREKYYRLLDAVTCLNHVDEAVWHSAGVANARYIPNPSIFSNRTAEYLPFKERQNLIVFIGRLCEIKGAVFLAQFIKRMLEKDETIKFAICGKFESTEIENRFRSILDVSKYPGAIVHFGFSLSVDEFLKKAKVHVMFSKIEGSPMVIGEARATGTPTVLFSKKYIDIASNGCTHVKFGDLDNFVSQSLELIYNEEKWTELSQDCYRNMGRWEDVSVYRSWMRLLQDINHKTVSGFSEPFNTDVLTGFKNEIDDVLYEFSCRTAQLEEKLRHEDNLMQMLQKKDQLIGQLEQNISLNSYKCRRYDRMMNCVDALLPVKTYRRKFVAKTIRWFLLILRK